MNIIVKKDHVNPRAVKWVSRKAVNGAGDGSRVSSGNSQKSASGTHPAPSVVKSQDKSTAVSDGLRGYNSRRFAFSGLLLVIFCLPPAKF